MVSTMELEFREVHIDLLAIPIHLKKGAASQREAELTTRFEREGCVSGALVVVKKNKPGKRHEVFHGHEVVRAARTLGIETIPCLIAERIPAALIDSLSSIASDDGEHLNTEQTIHTAIAQVKQLTGLKLSFRKAEKLGKLGKKSTLYDQKRLAKNLDKRVQALVIGRELSKSAARSISYLPLDEQFEFARRAIENNWSVRQIDLARSEARDDPLERSMSADLDGFCKALSEAIGLPVRLEAKTRLSGKLIIDFYGTDALCALLEGFSHIDQSFDYRVSGSHDRIGQNYKASQLIIDYKDLDLLDRIQAVLVSGDAGHCPPGRRPQ